MVILREFLKKESTAGVLLILATICALILSNSPLSEVYKSILHTSLDVQIGSLQLGKSLNHWVNDGLMVLFFLLIGLEVKREVLEGHLSSYRQIALPGIAAVGGMVVPAAVYLIWNYHDPVAVNGWAIPTATDIAFALGILSLLGSRVPVTLKLFLMALAIIDDLGAILIIAIFYTADLSALSIAVALTALSGLIVLNRCNVSSKWPYVLLGLILWASVLQSGVHATLAGVALAFTIPLKVEGNDGQMHSPSRDIEHRLHGWVAFLILPLFAFANAGVNVSQISLGQMAEAVPLGILLGLFIGKQFGVFGFSWLMIKCKLAKLPEGSTWMQLYGVSVLTGIGFTMSLFISSLAFIDDSLFQYTDKLAILIGSFLSGIVGYLILKYTREK